ncbi:MAG: hypothetical protein NC930_02715, partial [Candidatus Omnitrophica bacterium]|nr:hypothetical protein [Candidatus Omnitrophota bacterium]
EELIEFMTGHMDDILQGRAGGNLLQKYSVKLWFKHRDSLIEYAVAVARTKILPRADSLSMKPGEIEEQLQSIENYPKAVFVNVLDPYDIRQQRVVRMRYNVAAWKAENFRSRLDTFCDPVWTAQPGSGRCGRDYVLTMNHDQMRYVEDKVQAFGNTPQGIGKMLTPMFLKDLRRDVCHELRSDEKAVK